MSHTLSRRIHVAASIVMFAASACSPAYYKPPALPATELAIMTLDKRASVITLDNLRVSEMNIDRELYVGPGCRDLLVKYEESFLILKENKEVESLVPSPTAALAVGSLAGLVGSESHNYETTKPIHFSFRANPGHNYWVTASFTGDQFLPRVVDIDPSGESVARILPDQACAGGGGTPVTE